MRAAVVTDLHFYVDANNNSYTPVMYGYEFFKRYHNIFENVVVVARGTQVEKAPDNSLAINGDGVETYMLPATQGIKEYAQQYCRLKKQMTQAIKMCDVAIIRMPSALSTMAVSVVKKLKKPYALEVVVDPYSVKPGKDLISRFVSSYIVHNCKSACLDANGVSYVTKEFLQGICPCQAVKQGYDTEEYFTANYSSVTLSEEYFATEPKCFSGKNSFVIAHTANLIQNEGKGHGIVIRTVAKLREKGFDVSAVFVGDGKAVQAFKDLAVSLGVSDYVKFVGKFADPNKVREQLCSADIYLFPSEAEGLPRGVIEAMACGLVCVASNVSGIPELLEGKDMYDPKDVDGYVNRLAELMDNTDEMAKLSSRNIDVARNYSTKNLTKSRDKFYRNLRNLVEKVKNNEY